MKFNQTFLTFCLMLMAMAAQSQKGSVMIGGNVGFANSKYDEFSQTVIAIDPFAGFFVIDKLAVGTSLALDFYSGDGIEGTNIGLGPFVRYYFTDASNIRPFAQAGFDWSSFKPKDGDGQSNTGFNGGVGVSFFLNNHVSIDGILLFDSSKVENDDDRTNTFGLGIGVQAFIGGGGSD